MVNLEEKKMFGYGELIEVPALIILFLRVAGILPNLSLTSQKSSEYKSDIGQLKQWREVKHKYPQTTYFPYWNVFLLRWESFNEVEDDCKVAYLTDEAISPFPLCS